MQFAEVLLHTNRMKDLSNFVDDGDVSDAFILFFPGKIHNNQQSTIALSRSLISYSLFIYLYVVKWLCFKRHFALRTDFITDPLYKTEKA